MGKIVYVFSNLAFALVELLLALYGLSGAMGVYGVFLGFVGIIRAVFSINGLRQETVVGPWWSHFESLLYVLGMLLLPVVPPSPTAYAYGLVGMAISTWALLSMTSFYTGGSPGFRGVCDWGPFELVRHPQVLGRIVIICGVLVGVSSWADGVRVGLCLCFCALQIVIEESFLTRFEAYRLYCQNHPYRLVPGVF